MNRADLQFNKLQYIPTHLSMGDKRNLCKLVQNYLDHLYNIKYSVFDECTEYDPVVCVEIGSYLGASSCYISKGIMRSGCIANLHCIDTWDNSAMSHVHITNDIFKEFKHNVEEFKHIIKPIVSDSVEAASKFEDDSVSILFLDGDHSIEGVQRDWDAWKPKLMANALVMFHDWSWAEGVRSVILNQVKPICRVFDCRENLWWGYL